MLGYGNALHGSTGSPIPVAWTVSSAEAATAPVFRRVPHEHVTDDDDVPARVESFIRKVFDVKAADVRFTRKVDLFDAGYIDSVGFAELIEFLQDEFSVILPDSILLSDEFLNIDGMAGIIHGLASDPTGP